MRTSSPKKQGHVARPKEKLGSPLAVAVTVDSTHLGVLLADGRSLTVPLDWFPRLFAATDAERAAWRLIGGGVGIHWELLDEDLSIAGLIAGRRGLERAIDQGSDGDERGHHAGAAAIRHP